VKYQSLMVYLDLGQCNESSRPADRCWSYRLQLCRRYRLLRLSLYAVSRLVLRMRKRFRITPDNPVFALTDWLFGEGHTLGREYGV
jgi:hypothetical protein